MAKYFTEKEMSCNGENPANYRAYGYSSGCGCGGNTGPNGISHNLYNLLDDIREHFGRPVHVTCAYRCPVHDRRVGGVGGAHTKGTAADIYIDGVSVDELANAAERFNADGVGRYYGDQFVHVDVREGRTGTKYRW